MHKKDYAFLGLVLSLGIHLVLVLGLLRKEPTSLTPPETIEIDLKEEGQTKWIVDSLDQPEAEKDISEKLKEQANLVSDITQRVKKQLRAQKGAKTQNASPKVDIKPQFNFDPSQSGQFRTIDPMLRKEAIGTSQFAETLPGVETGQFNSLNTDQLTYFSFYSRVNTQISHRWVSQIRNFLSQLSDADLKRLAQSDKRTVVEVLLDRDGNYFSSLIHTSSGVQALDEATYNAFRAASPFLNPPQGLVQKEDGLIHLYYQFVVVFRPNPMAGGRDF